ncbi:tyrosine-type recombinase/integrase [Roseateles flavus]|uniref:Integrase arm-type DNA-binding domain-containing protein n=1 Tax=Roseateles flavus TaxID=3149041 RepID=A0ABV0GGD6_9BURK
MATFDARAAKQLAAGQHLTVNDAPGLRLEATGSTRTWAYRYKSPINGLMKQLKLGAWPEMGLAQAFAAWGDAKAVRDAGRCPASEKRLARATEKAPEKAEQVLTVKRLLYAYIDRKLEGNITRKHLVEARSVAENQLGDLADVPAAGVTRAQAYDLIDAKRSFPVAAANLRRLLGAAWEWGHDSGRLSEEVPNWWRLILRGQLKSKGKVYTQGLDGDHEHQGRAEKVVLTLDQVGVLLRFLPNMSRLVEELLTLYLWTGTRGVEICMMEAKELTEEPDGLWWTIPAAKQKMRRHELAMDLRVPLLGRAAEIIRRRRGAAGEGGWIWPAVNKSAKVPHVQQKVIGVAVWHHRPNNTSRPEHRRARFPHDFPAFGPHDLRRTVRTHLSAMGCPENVAEAVLGHIQSGVAGVYDRYGYDKERRHWLGEIAARWEASAAAARP